MSKSSLEKLRMILRSKGNLPWGASSALSQAPGAPIPVPVHLSQMLMGALLPCPGVGIAASLAHSGISYQSSFLGMLIMSPFSLGHFARVSKFVKFRNNPL